MIPQPLRLAVALLSILAMAACGGGGDGGSGSTSTTASAAGTVGVLITDAPSDEFNAIEVTISRIELLGERRVVLFEGRETFDLLSLENFSSLFSVTENVPVGGYEKVRLTVDDLVLVREIDDGAGGMTFDEIRPKLPGGGKLDLNPRGTFFVVPGETLLLEIDMDARKSVKVISAGRSGKWLFRPVVFVRVLNDPRDVEKLARVHGTIRDLSSEEAFELCSRTIRTKHRADDVDSDSDSDSDSDQDSDSDRSARSRDSCLQVNLFADTTAFDDLGDPVDRAELRVGDPVTVVGFLSGPSGGRNDSDSDSDSDVDSDSDLDSDSDSDSDFDLDEAGLRLDAIVIEIGPLGTFPRLTGVAMSAVDADDDVFDLELDPGQISMDPVTRPVLLRPETAVLARDGFRIDPTHIEPGIRAEVDGVLDDSTVPDRIKSALVVLGIPETTESTASGVITNLDPSDGSLSLLTGDDVVCVEVQPGARILLLSDDGSTATSDAVQLEDLNDGVEADAYGVFDGGLCLQADTLIAIAE